MTKCSDCGRNVNDELFEFDSVCAKRGGHEARCTCTPMYHGSGLFFPLPPGAVPGQFAGLARGYGCQIHRKAGIR